MTETKEEEIWKINSQYPKYKISSFGNIININTQYKFNYNIENFKKIGSYIKTRLYNKDKIRRTKYIHSLVALTFIVNNDPINKITVNHKDGDIYNNKQSNLEWMSHKEQANHSVENKLKSSTSRGRPVKIYLNGDVYNIYKSISEAYRNINPLLKEKISSDSFFARKLLKQNKTLETNNDDEITGEYNDICKNLFINNEEEQWKPVIIDGEKDPYTGFYVSNFGRIKYKNKKNKEYLRNITNRRKYMIINIRHNKHKKSLERQVHRLVAEVFCEIPDKLKDFKIKDLTVDHINSKTIENYYKNLRWCTRSEQAKNEESIKNRGSKSVQNYVYDEDGNMVIDETFISISEAARKFKCDHTSISKILNTEGKCKDYYWKYTNDEDYEEKKKKDKRTTPIKNGVKVAKCELVKGKYKIIEEYNSIKEATIKYNYGKSTISSLISKNKSINDYYWMKLPIDKKLLYKEENKKDENKEKSQNNTIEKLEKDSESNSNIINKKSTDEQKYKIVIGRFSKNDKFPSLIFDTIELASKSYSTYCAPSRIKRSIEKNQECMKFYWKEIQVKC